MTKLKPGYLILSLFLKKAKDQETFSGQREQPIFWVFAVILGFSCFCDKARTVLRVRGWWSNSDKIVVVNQTVKLYFKRNNEALVS